MDGLHQSGFGLLALLVAACVFAAIELGYRLSRRAAVTHEQASAVAAPILALVGLLLAFSFSMAGDRFEKRREAAIQETNSIGTFWLRTSLLAEPARSQLQAKLRRYVDIHLLHRSSRVDEAKTTAFEAEADALQRELWSLIVDDARQAPDSTRQRLLVPSLNAMFDDGANVQAAYANRLPDAIFVYLSLLLVAAGIVVGYRPRNEKRSLVQWTLFVVVVSGVLVILLDMDRPRRGLIQTDPAPYERLRRSMDVAPP